MGGELAISDKRSRDIKSVVKAKVHFNQPWLFALIGLLLLLQLVVPYQGWLILLVGLGGGWFISTIWAWSLAHGLNLQREVRLGWVQVGDYLEEWFVLTNQGWARGLGIEVFDQSNLPAYQASRVVSVEGYRDKQWRMQSVCQRRGLFTLGPTYLQAGDPLGLYAITFSYPRTTTLIVMPRIVHLPAIQIAPGGRAGEGRRHKKTIEPTVTATGVQDYFPGAPSQTIHWPTSARRDSLFVRLFERTPAGDWWIFLDLEERVQIGQGHHSTTEHGIILAASLADRGLKSGQTVGLVAQGTEFIWLPPRLGDEQRWQILRSLALVTPGERPLADLLGRIQSGFRQSTSLIIITPAVADDWLVALLPLLRRGIIPTILLLDPISFGGYNHLHGTLAQLSRLGITHYQISRDLLDRAERPLAPR